MPQMFILKALANWLHETGKPQTAVDRYAARWADLGRHESLPCPKCYLDEPEATREQPLMALKAEGPYEPLFCVHCKSKFMVPEPA